MYFQLTIEGIVPVAILPGVVSPDGQKIVRGGEKVSQERATIGQTSHGILFETLESEPRGLGGTVR